MLFLKLGAVLFFLNDSTQNSPTQKLYALLDSIQNLTEVKHGTVAASVRSVSGEYKIQYNAQKAVNSASTLKLVSTATALSVLGRDYRYKTFLEYDGEIKDSILHGNLYLRSTGDPSLGSERFKNYPSKQELLNDWTAQIKQAGITTIAGYVVGDGSVFPENTVADTWAWNDIGNYYGAGIGGLNWNENAYKIIFSPSKTLMEGATLLRTEPATPHLTFDSKVLTEAKGTGDKTLIYSSPQSNEVWIEGTIPMGVNEFDIEGAIPDAAFWLGQTLQETLNQQGIKTQQMPTPFRKIRKLAGYYPKERKILKTYTSPTVLEMASPTNFESLNLYADAFLKTVGYEKSRDASFDSSIKILKQFWQNKGVDLGGFMIQDGSGLSSAGFLTTNNLSDILWTMQKDSLFHDFYQTIPVVGVSGTVKNLCKGSRAAGNIHAKSGSIGGTRAYAGYFTAQNGEIMSFAFIVNHYTAGAERKIRQCLEKLMIAVVEL